MTANGSVPASARGAGARAILNRPGGPDRDARRRAHNGLVLPEVLTVRLLVLSVVVLIAAVLLVPTVHAAVQQSMELHQLRGELSERQAEADHLQQQLDRWDDPAYIEGQARGKLQFVMPGDHVWRTIGGDTVVDDVDPSTGKPVDAGVVGTQAGSDAPWYAQVWDSVQVADGPARAAGQDGAEDESADGAEDGAADDGAPGDFDGEAPSETIGQ
ncbi:septum formation initiator family protein [Xylanimonas ulmi]|uniref:Cell division protein FtsB n=1 Tax=Xylanimonas ulmi TaxID=228973 RepID=A0A4Q7M1W1_9MICO|nr:septum formation initiator family protein [Xylanibacterium ulmi]RZS61835.1 cell division protein FtsB [Xylanibacterium ulmi]